ncbi:MAG TPA: MogA/MoaB family molybdenum cofactor biosynthesis protein [Stenomitos sp.]
MNSPLPHADTVPVSVACGVLTISDTRWQSLACGEVPAADTSGKLIQSLLAAAGHSVVAHHILPDQPEMVQNQLRQFADTGNIQAVILNGGTGIAPRDTTYDALATLLEKELPGFGELFRMLSYQEIGSRAIASRATAGIYRRMVIFSLPGSTKAVQLGMNRLILPELVHLTQLLQS